MSDETPEAPSESSTRRPRQSLAYATPYRVDASTDHMTRGDVACLTLRIIGVYVIVQALPMLATFIEYPRTFSINAVFFTIPFFGTILLGTTLIAWSQKLARWMLPRTAVAVSEPPGHAPAQMQAIAFSVLGLFFFVSSAPWLVYLITQIVASQNRKGIQIALDDRLGSALPSLLHYGVEGALGACLFLGSKRLSAWWWEIRHPELRYADAANEGKPPPPQ